MVLPGCAKKHICLCRLQVSYYWMYDIVYGNLYANCSMKIYVSNKIMVLPGCAKKHICLCRLQVSYFWMYDIPYGNLCANCPIKVYVSITIMTLQGCTKEQILSWKKNVPRYERLPGYQCKPSKNDENNSIKLIPICT